jgi:Gpi18-like mannosyltransferase
VRRRFEKISSRWRPGDLEASQRWSENGLIIGLFAVAVAVRLISFPHVTRDYTNFLSVWYEYADTHGGLLALRDKFSNYNVPYLYLLAGLTYVPVPALYGIKAISVVADFVLAFFVYRIVCLQGRARWVGVLAAVVVLLLPTVWMNSAMWAQADSIYSAFLVAGVYYLMRERPWLGCLLFGCALAFKLQAVFLFPLLLALVVVRYIPVRTLLAIPAAYGAWAVPALLLGHSKLDLLFVYLDQASGERRLTANAATVYQFFRIEYGMQTLRQVGILFTAGLTLLIVLFVLKSRRALDGQGILLLAVLFTITVPFFLPAMHERYFYLAEIFSVVIAFIVPRMFWVALFVQVASALSYVAFLFRTGDYGVSVDQRFLALLMFGALLITLREFALRFGLLDLIARQVPPPAPPVDGGRPDQSHGPEHRRDDGPAADEPIASGPLAPAAPEGR